MVRTSDQIRELLLESQAILRVPIELLWCDYLDGGINNLLEKTMVSEREAANPKVNSRAP